MAILHVKSPNGTTYNMTIVTSGTTESLDTTGWCRLPNGLIIQWTDVTTGNGGWFDWWFPIVFTSFRSCSFCHGPGAEAVGGFIGGYTDHSLSGRVQNLDWNGGPGGWDILITVIGT